MAGGKRDYKAEYARRKANAIIRARETKRGAPLSQAYRKRVQRALEKGKTLQQARGHKAREHVERAKRERKAYGITTAQMRTVYKWAEKRNKIVHDGKTDPEEFVRYAQKFGYENFTKYRQRWEDMRRNYVSSSKKGKYESKGKEYLFEGGYEPRGSEGGAVSGSAPDHGSYPSGEYEGDESDLDYGPDDEFIDFEDPYDVPESWLYYH